MRVCVVCAVLQSAANIARPEPEGQSTVNALDSAHTTPNVVQFPRRDERLLHEIVLEVRFHAGKPPRRAQNTRQQLLGKPRGSEAPAATLRE